MNDEFAARISDLYDKKLLDWLTNGKIATNPQTGEEENRDLTAAEMKVILDRIKHSGVTVTPTATNSIGQIVSRLRTTGGLKFGGLPSANGLSTDEQAMAS